MTWLNKMKRELDSSNQVDESLPYLPKKCAECRKPSYQGFNGRWWCLQHHPQRLCDGCGKNMGRYKTKLDTLCPACLKKLKEQQNGQ